MLLLKKAGNLKRVFIHCLSQKDYSIYSFIAEHTCMDWVGSTPCLDGFESSEQGQRGVIANSVDSQYVVAQRCNRDLHLILRRRNRNRHKCVPPAADLGKHRREHANQPRPLHGHLVHGGRHRAASQAGARTSAGAGGTSKASRGNTPASMRRSRVRHSWFRK